MTIWRLEDATAGCAVEIAPEFGCNCYQWQIAGDGRPVDLLHADPEVFPGGRPTRSGIPVLFPFPNRIRGGKFTWDGKTYQLPLNDPSGKNAIHGFACRHSWRLLTTGADAMSAWLTAEFRAALDAPETLPLWPADHRLMLTFRLRQDRLRLEAVIDQPDDGTALPFGLGFHPYFQLESPNTTVLAPAQTFWALEDSLPTGTRVAVDSARDLNAARPASALQLDDVLTNLPSGPLNIDGLVFRGRVGRVALWTSPTFRELVAFTPPHRQAVCLEPYTCTTDAVNLQAQGIDAGWMVLGPRQTWSSVIEMVIAPS
jgi:aldose 1-epimerase